MIEVHQTIDVNQYSGSIKAALLDNTDVEVFQSFGEIRDLSAFDKGIVYVSVVSVYVDWANSGKQGDRATILKAIYEAFNEHPKCLDIHSLGSYVVAIFDTPFKTDINTILDCVGKVTAMFNLVDKVIEHPTITRFTRGIGMNYGKALLVKCLSGEKPEYSWLGEAVGIAIKYSEEAKLSTRRVRASYTIYNNLKEDYQKLFSSVSLNNTYEADPVNIAMNKWINANV